jgi:hypothetical protein
MHKYLHAVNAAYLHQNGAIGWEAAVEVYILAQTHRAGAMWKRSKVIYIQHSSLTNF